MPFAEKWMFLMAAIVCEVAGTTMMKLSNGFANAAPSFFMFVFYGASLGSLALALKHMDISVAYAIWSGLGMMLIALIGIVFFNESVTPQKGISILLIIVGVAGLHYACSVS